ncbi:MAG: hypothetical protein WAU77_11390 [Solirubrobacteraceae bacterium]
MDQRRASEVAEAGAGDRGSSCAEVRVWVDGEREEDDGPRGIFLLSSKT